MPSDVDIEETGVAENGNVDLEEADVLANPPQNVTTLEDRKEVTIPCEADFDGKFDPGLRGAGELAIIILMIRVFLMRVF